MMRITKFYFIVPLLILGLIGIPACSQGAAPAPQATTPAAPAQSSAPPSSQPVTTTPTAALPSVQIKKLVPFVTVNTGDVTVSVEIKNFKLALDEKNSPNVPGVGHIHYYTDVDVQDQQGWVYNAATTEGHFSSGELSYTWKNVPVGTRYFSVELANNDHTLLWPRVHDESPITVTVAPTGPGVDGTGEGNTLKYDAGKKEMTITVDVHNFNVVNKSGQPNITGEGHIVYYFDEEAPVDSAKTALTLPGYSASSFNKSYTWKNVEPGLHSFSAQLVNNNDTPLNPPAVFKQINFALAPGYILD
jgi:hypothetical protein